MTMGFMRSLTSEYLTDSVHKRFTTYTNNSYCSFCSPHQHQIKECQAVINLLCKEFFFYNFKCVFVYGCGYESKYLQRAKMLDPLKLEFIVICPLWVVENELRSWGRTVIVLNLRTISSVLFNLS